MAHKQIDFTINLYDAKPLPCSPSLERQVLVAILDQPETFYPIAMRLINSKGMFYETLHDEMWTLIKENSTDKIASASKMESVYEGFRDGVKLNNFLVVARSHYLPSEFTTNCYLLIEYWVKRTIHRLGYHLNAHSLNETDPLDLLGLASESLDKIYRHIARMNQVTLADGVQELAKELVAIANSPDGMLGIKGSIQGLNHRIKGYRKGCLISVGATTGEGKTTLAIQEINHFIEQGIPTGAFSLEMKISEYVLIMAADKLGIKIEDVLEGKITADESANLGNYMERVKTMPLSITDKPAMKIGEIKALARMWKKQKNIQILFIDHGHLVEGDVHYNNTEQKFTDIANQLKALAKELDIPIVVLWQLHRKENEKVPHVNSNIKYAGGVEQASDVVLLIYRPYIHGILVDANGESTEHLARIIIGKLRLLPRFDVKCRFTGTRFLDEWVEVKPKELARQPDNPRAGIARSPLPFEDTPF